MINVNLSYINEIQLLKLNWTNELNVNQFNVNSWCGIMNVSVNSLRSKVIESWIVEWKSI